MTETVEKTPRQKSVDNGEQIVITIAVCFVLFEVLGTVVNIKNGQGVNLIRWILTLVSCFYLYKGKTWAKFILTFGALLGTVAGLFFTLRFLFTEITAFFTYIGIAILGMTIFNSLAAYYLMFSIDVDEFMKSRKV